MYVLPARIRNLQIKVQITWLDVAINDAEEKINQLKWPMGAFVLE